MIKRTPQEIADFFGVTFGKSNEEVLVSQPWFGEVCFHDNYLDTQIEKIIVKDFEKYELEKVWYPKSDGVDYCLQAVSNFFGCEIKLNLVWWDVYDVEKNENGEFEYTHIMSILEDEIDGFNDLEYVDRVFKPE